MLQGKQGRISGHKISRDVYRKSPILHTVAKGRLSEEVAYEWRPE